MTLYKKLFAVCLYLALALPTFASDSVENLQYIGVHVQFETNIAVAEELCAKLLLQYSNSPEALGKIYLSLALNNEYRHENDISKIIENSQMALRYPLDVMDACRACDNLAGGLRMKMFNARHGSSPRKSEHAESVMRKQILDVYLYGLKFVLIHAKTLQKQELPVMESGGPLFAFTLTNAMQTPEELEKIEEFNLASALQSQEDSQERQTRWKAYYDVVAANNLVDQYNWFKRDVIDLYRGISSEEEITDEGEKVAAGDPKVLALAKELVAEVKKTNEPTPPTSETKPSP
jgi:hypothetical protein